MNHLDLLLKRYKDAPGIYQAGRYWEDYEKRIISQIKSADLSQMRSGKYPIFATFGFNESVYHYRHDMPAYKVAFQKLVRRVLSSTAKALPYSLRLSDIRRMAFRHAELLAKLSDSKPIHAIETSLFGNPEDLFQVLGKNYTMRFLTFYIRYCYANQFIRFKGDEVIVELGSGSGHQVEVLKKLYPNLTILCFDLPAQLFLCEKYLSNALPQEQIVSSVDTLSMTDLSSLQKGKVHMFGNWQFPILKDFKFDVFWNSASFGEMEPEIVDNYLSFIQGNCEWIYLMQAAKGKESSEGKGVKKPMSFDFYNALLHKYTLVDKDDAYEAHRRVWQSGGYFQAVWQRN